jgi:hypothetical protein
VHNNVYEDIATKFFEHFLHIAEAMNNIGDEGIGLWNEQDEFYYDVLSLPNGQSVPLKVRSMVGTDSAVCGGDARTGVAGRTAGLSPSGWNGFSKHRPELANSFRAGRNAAIAERHLLSLLRGHRMKCLLRRMLDETEFLSDYGVRALSKVHERAPYQFRTGGHVQEVGYWPANRCPAVRRQLQLARPNLDAGELSAHRVAAKVPSLLRRRFQDRMPDRLRQPRHDQRSAERISRRLTRLFIKGRGRPAARAQISPKLATDPHFKDYVLFHEYFHGDTGRGVGASHQTGWTGLRLQETRNQCQRARDLEGDCGTRRPSRGIHRQYRRRVLRRGQLGTVTSDVGQR